jgi:hypothetical protein
MGIYNLPTVTVYRAFRVKLGKMPAKLIKVKPLPQGDTGKINTCNLLYNTTRSFYGDYSECTSALDQTHSMFSSEPRCENEACKK